MKLVLSSTIKYFFGCLAICFSVFQLHSQSTSKLNSVIENLKKDNALKHASWSICVMNTKKDSAIAEYNSTMSLVPASTMKIVTTGAALSILGSNFKFETKIQYDGTFDSISGVLKGNLYITGGGDPTLESEYFKDKKDTLSITEKWAFILKAKGIKKIDGAIIGDASVFEDNMVPSQWIWGDMGNYFGAGACGLTFHDNKYTLYFKSGATGTKTTINKILPDVLGLQIVNNVSSGGNDDNAFVYGSPYNNYRFVQGTIPPSKNNYEVEGSIPDPALFCAQSLESSLKIIGINVTEKSTTIRALKEANEFSEANRRTFFINYSPTLDKIVYWTNLKSINLYAEHLLKYISYKKTNFGCESQGTDIVTNFWKNKGVDVSGFFMNDGCGLARANDEPVSQLLNKIADEKARLVQEGKTKPQRSSELTLFCS